MLFVQEAAKDAAARMKNAKNEADSVKSDLDTLEHDVNERVSHYCIPSCLIRLKLVHCCFATPLAMQSIWPICLHSSCPELSGGYADSPGSFYCCHQPFVLATVLYHQLRLQALSRAADRDCRPGQGARRGAVPQEGGDADRPGQGPGAISGFFSFALPLFECTHAC